MPIAVRTLTEAREYVQVHLLDCPGFRLELAGGYQDDEGRRVTRFVSRRSPDAEEEVWPFLVADNTVDGYGEGTSTAVDGGQWLLLYAAYENQLGAQAEQMFGPELRPLAEAEDYQRRLLQAEDCLTELRKLLVERGNAESTVWTEQGRAMLTSQPAAFDVAWIDARIGELRAVGERLVARYRDAEQRGLI